MKKTLTLCIVLGILFSCTTEVDDIFDTTSSERLEAHMLECKQLLVSAENGWIIQYYPSSSDKTGGQNFVAKFKENGYVEASGEMADNISKTFSSHYSILSSNSVTLSFDTYNQYLHYWSDPDHWNANEYGGDFEWMYVSGDDNEMIFKGVKTGNTIVFTALQENMISYLQKTLDMRGEIQNSVFSYFAWDDGTLHQQIFYYDDDISVLTYYPDVNHPFTARTMPFTYTATGVSLYEPITINDIIVKNFEWDGMAMKLTSIDAKRVNTEESVNVSMNGELMTNYINYDKFIGSWTLAFTDREGNSSTEAVSLAEKVANKSFNMSGLAYDIEVGFNKRNGNLSIVYQYLGIYASVYYVSLCPVDGSYVYWGNGYGLNAVHNGNVDNLVLTFKDNGITGNLTGFFMFLFYTDTPSSSSAAGYIYDFSNMQTLTKN